MSTGRTYDIKMDNHLGKNPHTNTFVDVKSAMAKLDHQLAVEEAERKVRKESKKNGERIGR